jgi:hypothetical protein
MLMLLELVNQKIPSGPGAGPFSQAQLEEKLLSLWFSKMQGKSWREWPGTRAMPTIDDFAKVWNAEFPDDKALDSLMKAYGMK